MSKINKYFKTLSSEIVHENPHYNVRKDAFEDSAGKRGTYYVVDQPGFAMIIPFDEDGSIFLVDMYRYTTGERGLEFPSGDIEKGEQPEESAGRELFEETGLVAEKVIQIGSFYTANGVSNDKGHIFVAYNCKQASSVEVGYEGIVDLVTVTPGEMDQICIGGRTSDGVTIAAWAKYRFSEQGC